MKIVLVALNAKYVHTNIAVRYLKNYTANLDYEAVIKEFSINDRAEKIVEEIMQQLPQIVCFSCYIWNMELVLKVASVIRQIDENIEIVYGGPEVSYDSDELVLHRKCDYLIKGEGEYVYRDFVKYKLGLIDKDELKGIAYRSDNNSVIYKGEQPQINMDELPFPYEGEELNNNKIVYYEASRGCPFNCSYCLSSTIKGVRQRDIELVKRDLKIFMDKEVPLVKFVDRTFNCSGEYSRQLWKFLCEADTKTCFHFEIEGDLLREEDIEILRSAPKGRFQFEIGVQTTNNSVLNNISRRMNLDTLKKRVSELQEIKNIKLHLDLIAALPGEDISSFIASFDEVYKMRPQELQLGFLKLLKGSSIRYDHKKWNYRFLPYPPYEVLSSADISYQDIIVLKKVEEMVDKYNNSGKFTNTINYLIKAFESPYEFFYKLSIYYDNKGYFNRSLSGADYYRCLFEFNKEILKLDETIVHDVIKYDFLDSNKKSWIPDFLQRNVSKDTEKELKLKFAEENNIKALNKIFVEGFNIDMKKVLDNEDYMYRKCCCVYSEQKSKLSSIYYM
ncbi:B12-binding domain-containing radical SAM protein [Clostridium oryzae]|uniref:tRNA-2-methylthio-N(6)-dimethylallyladenosine synthase n=1 Tax=Clostridium oryzae TaxID=1450648 RepID=A0A1V4IHY9_9CLOT|nr:B12-binding domain-containing radical SAM protein [Clostridium oryzae]OPJ59573.1 tRNA-2-methylthio-N(6)-dimethylallyladenosine synthase [Clostridium oryzae]